MGFAWSEDVPLAEGRVKWKAAIPDHHLIPGEFCGSLAALRVEVVSQKIERSEK